MQQSNENFVEMEEECCTDCSCSNTQSRIELKQSECCLLKNQQISELEAFCGELVRQIEEWRKLDKEGKLVANKLESSF